MLYLLRRNAAAVNGKKNREEEQTLGRKLLLYGLKKEYGIGCLPEIEFLEHGKPYFKEMRDIHFNISHCSQGILCGVSAHPIGTDIERMRPYNEKLAKRICHYNEWTYVESSQNRAAALCRIWVAKESYLKYTGTGIACDLRQLDLSQCKNDGFLAMETQFLICEEAEFCIAAAQSKGKMDLFEVPEQMIL